MGNQTGLPHKTSAATHATEEDDVRTLWVDTDSRGNRWKPFRDAVYESCTATLSTWDLLAPPTALDFCRYTSHDTEMKGDGTWIGNGTTTG